jgi:tricorn protease-like protein
MRKTNAEIITKLPLSGCGYGLAVDDKRIFMTKTFHHLVVAVNKEQPAYSSPQLYHNNFDKPYGVCIDDDNVYVVDTFHHQIEVLNKQSGVPIRKIGTDLRFPYNVAVDRDTIYIADKENDRIQIYHKRDGTFKKQISNFQALFGIAVDDYYIYITNNHIGYIYAIYK